MNTIKMPGFTAEASLQRNIQNYQSDNAAISVSRGDVIIPQACRRVQICYESEELQQSVCRAGFSICD